MLLVLVASTSGIGVPYMPNVLTSILNPAPSQSLGTKRWHDAEIFVEFALLWIQGDFAPEQREVRVVGFRVEKAADTE